MAILRSGSLVVPDAGIDALGGTGVSPVRRSKHGQDARATRRRRGVSSLDYVLLLAVTLPTVGFFLVKGKLAILMVYEMICVLVSWPFV